MSTRPVLDRRPEYVFGETGPGESRDLQMDGLRGWRDRSVRLGLGQRQCTVALSTIADHFETDLPTAQWVIIAYALTISALLLPMGRLSNLVGRRRVYMAGFGLFVAGAVLSALATSVFGLLAPRALMGVGAAMTQATAMAIVISAFPVSERGKALGLQMSAVGSGAMAGPALGGMIVSLVGWRGVFVVTAILGTVAMVAAYYLLRPDAPRAQRDWRDHAILPYPVRLDRHRGRTRRRPGGRGRTPATGLYDLTRDAGARTDGHRGKQQQPGNHQQRRRETDRVYQQAGGDGSYHLARVLECADHPHAGTEVGLVSLRRHQCYRGREHECLPP